MPVVDLAGHRTNILATLNSVGNNALIVVSHEAQRESISAIS